LDTDRPPAFQIPDDNRPAPLFGTGLSLLEDETSQMSFGERAALVGVLSRLRPKVAVEVGTYEGGSLRFLAEFAEFVHTIDLFELVPELEAYRNVDFRKGDSAVLLPALLSELAAGGTDVDFALIDGDHSTEGVCRDLRAMLDSPATARTVILVHDTMNPEVRAGIDRARLAEHPRVVYYELDFVPGYEFAGGHFDGQVWGGLGLIVNGDRSISGYGDAPGQSRYTEPFRRFHEGRSLKIELDAVRRGAEALGVELSDARTRLERSRALLTAIEGSLSWRLTAPLRAAKRALAGRRGV
jgi:hypothetical protein